MIAPLLAQQEKQHTNIQFVEVDTDQNQDIARAYQITAMPTMVLFQSEKEVQRVQGANPPDITKALNILSDKNKDAVRNGVNGGESSSAAVQLPQEAEQYIPRGFEVLNDLIHFGEAEGLNINNASTDLLRELFATKEGQGVVSEADSQLMFYLPLNNKVKVQSIVLKSKVPQEGEGDEDIQKASKIKVWANTTGTISFEEAESGSKALHSGPIAADENGWAEIKLRYVHFQNVSSLLIFADGDDEEASTAIQQILLVGSRGESRERGKLEKIEQGN
jgi:hypothetical protein